MPGCLTFSETTDKVILMAKETLALHLSGMEEDNDIIPNPSDIPSIKLEESQAIILIEVWMPIYRDKNLFFSSIPL
jgi:predicted RNase H-like HicB family nuclease